MATLFAEINSITDDYDRPTYNDPGELIQALRRLHLRDTLDFKDDSADDDGQNDIDILRINDGIENKDYAMRE